MPATPAAEQHPGPGPDNLRFRNALRGTLLLIGCYAGLSLCTLVAVLLLRDDHAVVTDAVWVRVTVVVVTSLLMASFAARTARGHRRSYLRLRLASGVMVVAVALVVALPGGFPAWLKVEQGVCGVLLLGVVLLVNSRPVRAAFARPATR